MTACAGCGVEAATHPFVAVMNAPGASGFVGVGVCLECWRDPAHRTTPLKAHFFASADRDRALARAGSSNIG